VTHEDLDVARAVLLVFGTAALLILVPGAGWAVYILIEIKKRLRDRAVP